MGDHPEDYEMRMDPGAGRTGKASATIKGKGSTPAGFGTLMQSVQAGEYKGKRIRLSGWTKAAGIISFGILLSGAGQAWMDDLSLDVVGRDVPLTGQALGAPANRKPVNLDFES